MISAQKTLALHLCRLFEWLGGRTKAEEMTLCDFENLAGGIQSIVIALGLLTGGLWALFRFQAFRETEKARAELNKLKREIVERGVIKITLNPSVIKSDTKKYIKLDMEVKNTGNRNELLDWNNGSIKLVRCKWKEDGACQFCDWQDLFFEFTKGVPANTLIRPNQVSSFGYISKSITCGIYNVEAIIPGSPETITEHMNSVTDDTIEVLWVANTYIEVNDEDQLINPPNS
ncbi:hypothetical protein ACFL6N_02250 [Thermodesulfobacteriota bacterium]